MKFATGISLITLLILSGYLPVQAERVSSAPFETTGTMREETRYVIHCLETQHYLSMPLTSLDAEDFIESYINDLDPQKLFFHKSDVEDYKTRFGPSLHLFLDRGRLYPAFVIFEDYRNRVYDRVDWIQARLDGDFDFDSEETYAPDRDEAEWPLDQAEADELWENRLHYQMLNRVLADLKAESEEPQDTVVDNTALLMTETGTLKKGEAESTIDVESVEAENSETDELVVTDEILTEARDLLHKRYTRMEKSLSEIEATEVQEIFLTALTHMYDPHSTYFSADSLEEFAIAMRNSLVGIGAVLSDEDGYCTVKELLPGGPAERSRELDPEDKILAVAQGEDGEFVDVIGMKLTKIVKKIRGKQGSVVRLLVRPAEGDPSDRKTVILVRDEIKLTANLARAEVFQVPVGNTTVPIGVIDLPAFYGSGKPGAEEPSTTHDVEELISKLKAMGVEGIVLDLRRNGGGLLSEAISLTGLFIPDGPVVQVRDVLGKVQGWSDEDSRVVWDGPLIVLVSRFSASASEIVAGALKNHGRAIIVGDEETHGKGTVQAVFEMNRSNFLASVKPKKGAAKVTVQKYYLPSGTSTQIKGVSSDIVLPSINEHLPIGEGDLPNALVWDAINSLDWEYSTDFEQDGMPVNQHLLKSLRERSLNRQGALEEFSYLKSNIDWFREKQEQEEYSLNLETRLGIRAEDKVFRDSMEESLRDLAEMNFDSEEVLLRVTEEQNAEHDAIVAEREAEKAQQAQATDGGPAGEEGTVIAVDVKEETEEEDLPDFDIHLRESLRIMADWIDLGNEAERSAVIAKSSGDKNS